MFKCGDWRLAIGDWRLALCQVCIADSVSSYDHLPLVSTCTFVHPKEEASPWINTSSTPFRFIPIHPFCAVFSFTTFASFCQTRHKRIPTSLHPLRPDNEILSVFILFSKFFGSSPRKGPLLEENSNTSMPTVQGSQPWLKPFIIASLSIPPTTPSLNANYLQVVSTVSRRNELTVYDGQFTMPAVLTAVAATDLDADEDDSGVTTRNLLGHVLAPVQVKVLPDTNSAPPTVLLLMQSVRVLSDRTYQRPPGRIPHVYADADVCDALLAVSSRKLATFGSAADSNKFDDRDETNSLSHALSSF